MKYILKLNLLYFKLWKIYEHCFNRYIKKLLKINKMKLLRSCKVNVLKCVNSWKKTN